MANTSILSIAHRLGGTGYIDIHKDDPAHPADYDVTITDIDEDILRTEVSQKLGILYPNPGNE